MMSETLRKAAQAALSALEGAEASAATPHAFEVYLTENQIDSLCNELRAALEKPEQSEPVAVFYRCNHCGHAYEDQPPSSCDCMDGSGFERVEYFTHPPRREPLTPEEIWNNDEIMSKSQGKLLILDLVDLVRAVEAAHGITGEKP
jgi:rubredoxin